MRQLQQITEIINNLETGPAIIDYWKKSVADGHVVDVLYAIKSELIENRKWIVVLIGELLTQTIEEFNPVIENEILLEELNDLWMAPRDSRNFSAIRKMIYDIETLYKIAELKK
jgi:hypothetical protein